MEKAELLAVMERAYTVQRRVAARVHHALMHGDMIAKELRDNGEVVDVPAAKWRVDGVDNEFHCARDHRSPFTGTIFVREADLEKLFAGEQAARTVAGEKRLIPARSLIDSVVSCTDAQRRDSGCVQPSWGGRDGCEGLADPH